MHMQKDRYALIASCRKAPPGWIDAVIEEEVVVVGVGRVGVQPAGSVEPEDLFVAVGAEAGDDVLGYVFELASEGAHDEDWDCGGDGAGDMGWESVAVAVNDGWMFWVGEGADRFDEGDVGGFEAFGEVPGGLIVIRGMLFEGGMIGAAQIDDLR